MSTGQLARPAGPRRRGRTCSSSRRSVDTTELFRRPTATHAQPTDLPRLLDAQVPTGLLGDVVARGRRLILICASTGNLSRPTDNGSVTHSTTAAKFVDRRPFLRFQPSPPPAKQRLGYKLQLGVWRVRPPRPIAGSLSVGRAVRGHSGAPRGRQHSSGWRFGVVVALLVDMRVTLTVDLRL